MVINDEKCHQIVGFERYHISESGRIYRTESGKKRTWRTKGRIYISENKIHFKFSNNKLRQGYASLTDSKGKLHSVVVAPIMAITFGIATPKQLKTKRLTIGYKDGNKKNLHYSNLLLIEKRNLNSKLTLEDVKHIKKHIRKGIPLNRIASLFSVSEMQINRIKTGENWGNGKRKIKAPTAPFQIEDGRIRRYIATFEKKKTTKNIRKTFTVKRNPEIPTDNTITGIVKGYKLSLKHKNITRAREIVNKLNEYFFDYKSEKKMLPKSV
ncbi:hypothetical protein [Zobellia uliginosa]|uniref:hypothetical protein n=1 Tax=Zobellia uliginosa TaxID=143224 RepID=UPI001C06D08D|nr:hypothetical protein [Zobellia uliginosa]MBU2948315.1 hypothetical protein [Zobellia uliginosa]